MDYYLFFINNTPTLKFKLTYLEEEFLEVFTRRFQQRLTELASLNCSYGKKNSSYLGIDY